LQIGNLRDATYYSIHLGAGHHLCHACLNTLPTSSVEGQTGLIQGSKHHAASASLHGQCTCPSHFQNLWGLRVRSNFGVNLSLACGCEHFLLKIHWCKRLILPDAAHSCLADRHLQFACRQGRWSDGHASTSNGSLLCPASVSEACKP